MQCARKVLMVRPARPGSNAETRASNAFQTEDVDPLDSAPMRTQIVHEFDAAAARLRESGAEVVIFEDPADSASPDAIFPNNWFSTFSDGRHILYPMLSRLRRAERSPAILRYLSEHYPNRIDLTGFEESDQFLEGTGSLVLDHIQKQAYAGLSVRTDSEALARWSSLTGYSVVRFRTSDRAGLPIYHTNVLLSIGARFTIVCGECIAPEDRNQVLNQLSFGRELIEITLDQMAQFCGNVLEIESSRGPIIALSETALRAFDPAQIAQIEKLGSLVPLDVRAIERVGGGSVRCMLAELF